MDLGKCICVFLFFLKRTHGVTFKTVSGALPLDTEEFSIECSGESGSGVDFFKEALNLGSCTLTPSPDCILNPGYSFSIAGSNYTFKIDAVSSSSCGTYKCKDSGNSQEDIYELTYNKFSTDNTSLLPLEPTAGESGALNITTDCLYPASDQSITINWYKKYQDGKADEALDSSFEIYNETQQSTCTDTCGTDPDVKMVIGSRYTPPSNRGTGFQIKVEVIHKAYSDKLYWTFDGTYYDEECSDCCCCDDKKARDVACGTVLAVCICVMAVLVFCCFKGFPPKHFQGKIVLICAVIAFIAALVGFILSAICLSKECSGSGDSCQVKSCFKDDTIAGFVIAGLSVLGTIVVVILICLITGEPGSGKKKPVAEK